MRIIATYFTLIRQPIYHFSFCGNLLASPTLCVHPVIPVSPAYSIGSTLHKAMVTSSKLDFCWMLEANKLGPLRHQPQPAVAWNITASDNSCRWIFIVNESFSYCDHILQNALHRGDPRSCRGGRGGGGGPNHCKRMVSLDWSCLASPPPSCRPRPWPAASAAATSSPR